MRSERAADAPRDRTEVEPHAIHPHVSRSPACEPFARGPRRVVEREAALHAEFVEQYLLRCGKLRGRDQEADVEVASLQTQRLGGRRLAREVRLPKTHGDVRKCEDPFEQLPPNRHTFLTLSSAVAFAVALFALGFPRALLAGKGVQPGAEVAVWVREVGALILAAGVTTLLARSAPDSQALRSILIGNAVLHAALLPIEILALADGVITEVGGVMPNSVLHLTLAIGFGWHARRVQIRHGS